MISVVIPVYNAESYLAKCVKSILIQSYQNIEILLVNDGSTDLSGLICDELAQSDNRVKVFHQNNHGVSSARNLGLKHVQGDWVLFVDADDELYIDSISRLFHHIKKNVDMVIGGYRKYADNGEILYEIHDRVTLKMNSIEALQMMYKPIFYNYQGFVWNKLFNREIIANNNLMFNTKISFNEDRLFIVEYLACCNGSVIYDTTPVYKYYIRDGVGAMASTSNGFNPKYLTDFDAYILMYKKVKGVASDSKLVQLAQQGILISDETIRMMMKHSGVSDYRIKLYLVYNMLLTGCYWYRIKRKINHILNLHN